MIEQYLFLCVNSDPVADPGEGVRGQWTPGPVKLVIKKMAAKGGHIDFMFLPPYLATGSATELRSTCNLLLSTSTYINLHYLCTTDSITFIVERPYFIISLFVNRRTNEAEQIADSWKKSQQLI